jgi:hypothetical protein
MKAWEAICGPATGEARSMDVVVVVPVPNRVSMHLVYHFVVQTYEGLVARNFFSPFLSENPPNKDNRFKVVSKLDLMSHIPSFDGSNVVESACRLYNNNSVRPDKRDPRDTFEGRCLLSACISIACKNSCDYPAFPFINGTHYEETPLAVLYHLAFESLDTASWGDVEKDPKMLNSQIECTEGVVLAESKDLFSLLNKGVTSSFELLLADLLEKCPDYDAESVVAHRHIVAYYGKCILCGHNDTLRREFLKAKIDQSLVYAFALIASETVRYCSKQGTSKFEQIPGLFERLETEQGREHIALARTVVEEVMSSSLVLESAAKRDPRCGHLISYDTILRVYSSL